MDYLKQQQGAAAETVFAEMLKENPQHAAALHMLGVALFQQGKLESALNAMQQAIAQHGGHANWYANLSVVLTVLGMNDKAQTVREKAQRLTALRSETVEKWHDLTR